MAVGEEETSSMRGLEEGLVVEEETSMVEEETSMAVGEEETSSMRGLEEGLVVEGRFSSWRRMLEAGGRS